MWFFLYVCTLFYLKLSDRIMKFTIIGSGNSGLIHAAKLIENGFGEVGILKTSNAGNNDFFDVIRQEGGYNVKDETNGGRRFFVRPRFITKDVQLAVEHADVLMVTTTTIQHDNVARLIAPYVKDGQVIILCPGYMGSLIFRKHIRKDVVYSEWETTAYNGRIVDSMYVRITFYNPRNAISVSPVSRLDTVLELLSHCFANTHYSRRHILESAMHNPNMIVHPIGLLFSAARIEYSKGEFWMYKEAFTDSVLRVINAFDLQKNRILEAFGCDPLNYFEAAKWRNEENLNIDAMDVFRSFAESSNKGPSFIDHRYLNEDVPVGLGLFISIGKIVGVETAIPESVTTLASALVGRDLSAQARTIQSLLQKESVSIDDIKEAIR